MKDLPSPWQVIPFSPAYLGLEEGQQQARPLPPPKDPTSGKLPLTPWLKMKIDEGLDNYVGHPLAERGYPGLGAALVTVPSAINSIIPETYGDVMGAGVIGKGGKGLDNVVDLFSKKKVDPSDLKQSPWTGVASDPRQMDDVSWQRTKATVLGDAQEPKRDWVDSALDRARKDQELRTPQGRDEALRGMKKEMQSLLVEKSQLDSKIDAFKGKSWADMTPEQQQLYIRRDEIGNRLNNEFQGLDAPKGSEQDIINRFGKDSKQHKEYRQILDEEAVKDRSFDKGKSAPTVEEKLQRITEANRPPPEKSAREKFADRISPNVKKTQISQRDREMSRFDFAEEVRWAQREYQDSATEAEFNRTYDRIKELKAAAIDRGMKPNDYEALFHEKMPKK